MPRNMIDLETMELYKRPPASGYKDIGYHHTDLCSNCGRNEYEDMLRNITVHKKKMRSYERHCPSCHCPIERRRYSSAGRPRTSENIEAMLNRYEQISMEPINPVIKKSQSSPLSQKRCRHDYRMSNQSRCPKRLLQTRRQRRSEPEKYPSSAFRMKNDIVNSELTNEEMEACPKYSQSVPVKRSLKKINRCKKLDRSPDEQEYSDIDSEGSMPTMKYTQYLRQRKSHIPSLELRHHCVGDGEYITRMRNESDVDRRQNERECQEMRKLALESEELEELKRHEAPMIDEDNKESDRWKFDISKGMKSKKSDFPANCVTNKPSALVKGLIEQPAKELKLSESAHLAKFDLHATKVHILKSIDQMLGTMDDAKNDTPQQKQIEQENMEKTTRELQENDWQLLFNALTIHRNSADSSKRTVRLECLNHIQQQLDRLYSLESALGNCLSEQQLLSNYKVQHNEEHSHRALKPKIADV